MPSSSEALAPLEIQNATSARSRVRRQRREQPVEPLVLDRPRDPQHDDAPWMEPGQLMPRLVFKDPADRLQDPNPDPRKVAKAGRTFKMAVGPGLDQFRQDLLERRPQIRYIEVMREDDSGQRTGGNVRFVEDGREAADGEFTNVMVRLKAADLDIVDTLTAAGIAGNRAEAIRWALTRVRERPAYEQLREHTRDIERLKNEF